MVIPEQGQLVKVRNKYFLIQDVDGYPDKFGNVTHRVSLESVDEDDIGELMDVIWELEINTKIYESISIPKPEKWDRLERFEAFIHAIRWSTSSAIEGKDFSAPFHAAIDIEDYQLEPLYRAIEMPCVNLLLADDVGLGKTIETGLVIQELLSRKRIKRILVLCPASLQIKWKEEMESKFQLPFLIINRAEIQNLKKEYGIHVNPWNTFPRLITSFDFLKREQPLNTFRQSLYKRDSSNPIREWDLLIVDEAHNIAPSGSKNYIQDSDRTKLLMEIIDNFENRIFLTATPHNGYTESFTALLELLDPLRFSRGQSLDKKQLKTIMVRRLKDEIEDALGEKKFAVRKVKSFSVDLDKEESKLYELLNNYTESRISRTTTSKILPIRFTLTLLKKRLLSSPLSFYKSIETHYKTIKSKDRSADESLLNRFHARTIEDWDNDDEKNQYEDTAIEEGSKFFEVNEHELKWIEEMREISNQIQEKIDSKTQTVLDWISKNMHDGKKWNNERLVIFTEYKDTIEYLEKIFEKQGFLDRILTLTGGMAEKDRELIKNAFQSDPDSNPVRILLATDAISEGIDLQNYCKNLIHWEIPWNPNRMEQRNGRIDRHGQKSPHVNVWHFVFTNNEDSKFLQTIVSKVETMRHDLGSIGEIIADEIENTMLGLSNKGQLKLDLLEDKLKKVNNEIDYSKIDNTRLSFLRNKLESSKRELKINPENLFLLLNEGLKLFNHHGLKIVENGELKGKGYHLMGIPNMWYDLEHTIKDPKGNLKTIIFDPDIGVSRNDVVLFHLNHPIMRKIINEFRRNLWTEEFHQDQKLYKSSYKILPNQILSVPVIVAFFRILAVSKTNQKIHESVQSFGAEIKKDQLIWLDENQVNLLLETKGTFANLPKHIGDFLRENFPKYESQIKNKILEIQKNETFRIKEILKGIVRDETSKVTNLIKDRIKEINSRISEVTDLQMKITRFTEDENQQLQEDIKWLKRRKLELDEQLHNEPEIIKRKFELSKEIRVFPLGILYLLPEKILEGQ